MKAVFFYGLFMDEDLLIEKGLHPTRGRVAYADGYGLRIGERATLVKSPSERSYGMVVSLEDAEVQDLYSAPSVSDYIPEQIPVTEPDGATYTVTSYNLPVSRLSGRNKEYARSLAVAARKAGLPETYVDEIITWAG